MVMLLLNRKAKVLPFQPFKSLQTFQSVNRRPRLLTMPRQCPVSKVRLESLNNRATNEVALKIPLDPPFSKKEIYQKVLIPLWKKGEGEILSANF
jgi:hypothetical protein